jgi:tetratricopeptide (TPR) repeat protein
MSGAESANVADVSLCLIVKNEAQNVGRCLRSVAGVVSEAVVLDTGSSDETVAIAEASGARVFHAPWENDFSKARNTAIDHARCGWILVLDADEELGAGWSDVLQGALRGTDAAGFRVIVENLLPAADVARVAEAPSVRLFRNLPGYRYENAIHEQVRGPIERLGGRVDELSLRIVHYGYVSESAQGQSRVARNVALLLEEVRRSPRDAWVNYHLGIAQKAASNLRAAQKHLREALALGRGVLDVEATGRAECALAQIELGAGKNAKAAAFARRSLSADPGNLAALHVLALATFFGGDARAAAPIFEAVRRSPHCNPALVADLERAIAFGRRSTAA